MLSPTSQSDCDVTVGDAASLPCPRSVCDSPGRRRGRRRRPCRGSPPAAGRTRGRPPSDQARPARLPTAGAAERRTGSPGPAAATDGPALTTDNRQTSQDRGVISQDTDTLARCRDRMNSECQYVTYKSEGKRYRYRKEADLSDLIPRHSLSKRVPSFRAPSYSTHQRLH